MEQKMEQVEQFLKQLVPENGENETKNETFVEQNIVTTNVSKTKVKQNGTVFETLFGTSGTVVY